MSKPLIIEGDRESLKAPVALKAPLRCAASLRRMRKAGLTSASMALLQQTVPENIFTFIDSLFFATEPARSSIGLWAGSWDDPEIGLSTALLRWVKVKAKKWQQFANLG